MIECGTDSPVEHTLLQEDAVSIHSNTQFHSSHLMYQTLDRLCFVIMHYRNVASVSLLMKTNREERTKGTSLWPPFTLLGRRQVVYT